MQAGNSQSVGSYEVPTAQMEPRCDDGRTLAGIIKGDAADDLLVMTTHDDGRPAWIDSKPHFSIVLCHRRRL